MSGQCPSLRSLARVVAVGLVALTTIAPNASGRDRAGRESLKARGATAEATARMSSAARAVFLGGFTSQNEPVVIDVAKSWKSIPMMRIAFDMRCTSGNTPAFTDFWARLPVGAHGRVRVGYTIPPSSTNSIEGGTDSLSGTLNRRRETFSGVWRLQITFSEPNGQSDSCDSGTVAFTASL